MKAMGPEEACFFTQQIFLIGTEDEDGSPRFAPISWVSYSWGSPACLVISMYGTKQTKKKYSQNQTAYCSGGDGRYASFYRTVQQTDL